VAADLRRSLLTNMSASDSKSSFFNVGLAAVSAAVVGLAYWHYSSPQRASKKEAQSKRAAAFSAHSSKTASPARSGSSSRSSRIQGPHYKVPHVTRVKTPYGYGVLDHNRPYTENGLMRVHLPNKTMGYLNPTDVQTLPRTQPIYVRTPFGLGEIVHPIQLQADLVPGDDRLFTVKLTFGLAKLNSESLRVHNYEPFPIVETPYGKAQVVDPPQSPYELTVNESHKVVVKFDWGATGYLCPEAVTRTDLNPEFEPTR